MRLEAKVVAVVEAGDTLSRIAERVGVPMEALIFLNGIRTPDLIFPGQRIVLPDATDEAYLKHLKLL
jgi:LysM repeat protein